MSRTWSNNGITTLTANISNAATTATVDNGAVFGTPSASNEMTAVIRQGATRELVHITNVSGNTLTLVRGREGTTGQAFTAGATIANVVTKAFTDEVETLLAAGGGSASAFGVFSQFVGNYARGAGSDQIAAVGSNNSATNGTLTARNFANSPLGVQPRVGAVSAAAINSPAGRLFTNQGYTPATEANTPPILMRVVCGISDATFQGTAAFFVGTTASGGSVGDPATLTTNAHIGIGASPGDTTLALYHSSGGGSVTKVSLGANFPANTTNTDCFEIELRRQQGAYAWTYRVRNIGNGQVTTGTATTNIPNSAITHQWHVSRNTLTGTAAVGVDFSYFTVAAGAGA